jgi:hypothetical protein
MRVFRFVLAAAAALTLACSQQAPVAPDVVGGGAAGTLGSHPGEGGRPISVEMTGAAEAPGPGDPDGSGTATFQLNQGQGEICFELTVSDIDPATASHIHIAPVGAPGPVVVPLTAPTSGSSSGCVAAAADLIKAIRQNPENYYVNVHNAAFPGGAVRAQLSK